MELTRLTRILGAKFLRGVGYKDPIEYVLKQVNNEAGVILSRYCQPHFLTSFNGLLLKGSSTVNKVYCSVFINEGIVDEILGRKEEGIMLFAHHPLGFEERAGFMAIPAKTLEAAKSRGMSIYTLHYPLDINSEWSTSVQLAKILGIKAEGELAFFRGKPLAVYGKPELEDLEDFARYAQERLVAPGLVKVLFNHSTEIKRLAVVAGGGAYPEILQEAYRLGCNTFLTGNAVEWADVPVAREVNRAFRALARELEVNLISAGHYHTEKIAVCYLTRYFQQLGLEAEYVGDDTCYL